MNKEQEESEEAEMLPEYDFSGGVRGKYSAHYQAGSHIVQHLVACRHVINQPRRCAFARRSRSRSRRAP